MQLSLEVCLSSCKNALIILWSYNTLMIGGSSVCFFTHIWLFARSSSAQFRLTFCSMSEPVSSSGSYAGFGCPSNKSFTLTPALDTWVQYNSCWCYKWLWRPKLYQEFNSRDRKMQVLITLLRSILKLLI